MHAPATPGDSVPGDAAGDDSEQGSGSNEPEEDAVAPVVNRLRVKGIQTYEDVPLADRRVVFTKPNGENMFGLFEGSGLDGIDGLKMNVTYDNVTTDFDLTKQINCNDTRISFKCVDMQNITDFVINKVYNDDVVLYDMTACPIIVTIVVESADETMGTVTGGGEYNYRSQVTIEATPNPGYRFKQWSPFASPATYKFSARANRHYIAQFEVDPDYVEEEPVVRRVDSVEFSTEDDTITLAEADKNYPVHITPNKNYMVILHGVGLSDLKYVHLDYLKNGGAYQTTLSRRADSTDTVAYFTDSWGSSPEQLFINYIEGDKEYFYDMRGPQKYATLTLSSNDETMGTTNDSQTMSYNRMVVIQATAKEGYHFVQWSDGETEAERFVTVNQDIELQAIFAPDGE